MIALAAGCGAKSGTKAPDASMGCTDDRQCSAPTPACDIASHTCVQCRFSAQCASDKPICEAETCRIAHGCAELASELPGLPAGVYTVDPGSGAMSVYCETAAGGGWTLVQRTRWAWADSSKLHTDFATWATMTIGMPQPGNAYRLAGTMWPSLAVKGDVMLAHRIRTTTGGACNPLYYVGTGSTITVDTAGQTAMIANLTQPVGIIADPRLTTTSTGPNAVCVNAPNFGVPWFYSVCCSTCPTYQGGYWTDEPHPMESYSDTADATGKTEAQVCAGQSIVRDQSGSTFRGVDSMEVYLR